MSDLSKQKNVASVDINATYDGFKIIKFVRYKNKKGDDMAYFVLENGKEYSMPHIAVSKLIKINYLD